MEHLDFSFIIPVYNRPQEIKELLQSFVELEGKYDFEIVIIEDGSNISSEEEIERFKTLLNISYYFKENSGPGDSRNFGMRKAKGNYFIILDSDVLLPPHYLNEVKSVLDVSFYDCFGGPDAAHSSFSKLQKAINFSMTSFITTGGIRGSHSQINSFQPRSFNMGLSKKAFLDSKGFGNIHPGEDPDLSLRLLKLGYETTLIERAFVYHKRRIDWSKFYKQVHKFGLARPILNKWHPESKSLVFWFPLVFSLGLLLGLVLAVFGIYWLLGCYIIYFITAFILSAFESRSPLVGFLTLFAINVQFFGYGFGFIKSTLAVGWFNRNPEEAFPKMFFNPL